MTPFTPPRPKNMVQAIERAAAILDLLGQFPHGLSVGELAQRTGLPKGTVHRLLSSLSFYDYVRQEPSSRHYQLGFKLVELGNRLLSQIDLRDDARPFLIALAGEVQETVHLVVRDKDRALYVDKVGLQPESSGLQMVSRIGARTDLHSSAVGKILLAALPEDHIDTFVGRCGLPRKTDHTITDAGELKRHLADIRRQAFAIDDEENEKGIRCVGAPVRDAEGRVIAAVSISGPTARVSRERVAHTLQKKVCETAMKISRQIGFRE